MAQNNKKVLIVEDDKDFSWLLKTNFENQGLDLVYAVDGQEGLDMAQKEKPDLMIVDILLPKIDGIEMVRRIKEQGVQSQIIFLTNFKDAEHVGDALEAAGQVDYFVKSDMHIGEIVGRVKEKLGIT